MFRSKLPVLCQIIRNKSTNLKSYNQIIKCGQPTAESHPHLIKPGEIVPNISISEFQIRRQNLVESILKHSASDRKNHIIVIPSATKKYMSDRIPYVFRQNSDFLYFSGCLEPDSCLILEVSSDSSNHRSTLFVKKTDSHSELWDGPSTSPENAPYLFGVDNALPMIELASFIRSKITEVNNCTLWYDVRGETQPSVDKIIALVKQYANNIYIETPLKFIHKLRLIKSPAECVLMKNSCNIASEAFHKTMAASKPNITEHELFATVDYECRMKGAEYLAYPPVVAGGNRATTIHYINNNQVVRDGEMVLMDAGCELHGYSSDITRTWPVNGKFSPEQRLLYEVIYSIQTDLIQMVYHFPTLDYLFDKMCKLLAKNLQEIGLIPKTTISKIRTAYEFCPHHVSHYLGMDVHDTPLIMRNIPLQPGMIITIEPGVYINESNKYSVNVPKKFRGLGIRIEDNVLITESGPVILSENCKKDPTIIENIVNSTR